MYSFFYVSAPEALRMLAFLVPLGKKDIITGKRKRGLYGDL